MGDRQAWIRIDDGPEVQTTLHEAIENASAHARARGATGRWVSTGPGVLLLLEGTEERSVALARIKLAKNCQGGARGPDDPR